MKRELLILVASIILIIVNLGCAKTGLSSQTPPADTTGSTIPDTTTKAPVLTGKLIFHRYDQYGDASKLYLYDFTKNSLTTISENWNIFDPINAQFNFDGSQIVFMGEATQNGKWDIYTWKVGSSDQPVNLTAKDGCRDEDAHFSPDGNSICFKQTPSGGVGNLKTMDLSGVLTNNVTNNNVESGMPFYTADATALIYARGAGITSDIYIANLDGTNNHALAATVDVDEYYPIVLGPDTFLYSRWYSSSNKNDQIYLGYFANSTRTRLPFNTSTADYSDAYPCGSNLIFISCDRSGGSGAYDLYIANSSTGAMWSLSSYNASVNSSLNELGSSYTNKE